MSDDWHKMVKAYDELRVRCEKAEAQLDRLTSRGIEDLHHENDNLKATLNRLRHSRELSHKYAGCTADNCLLDGDDCSAAIKGEK